MTVSQMVLLVLGWNDWWWWWRGEQFLCMMHADAAPPPSPCLPCVQVDGILVQLPLPKHINEQTVLDAISIDKDVDGFHPVNIGSLAMRGREPLFVSCTPKVWRTQGCGNQRARMEHKQGLCLLACRLCGWLARWWP